MLYELFNPVHRRAPAVYSDPRQPYIQSVFRSDIERVKLYYKTRTRYIANDHILVKLISALEGSSTETMTQCYQRVTRSYRSICSMLGIGTYATFGYRQKNYFYQNTDEYVFANNRYFPVSTLTVDWQELQPVKVLVHEVHQLTFLQPGALCHCDSPGYSVVEIDPVKLACGYKAFKADSIRKNLLGYAINPKEYISRFVLPNMLDTHMDLVIANRAAALYSGRVDRMSLSVSAKRLKQPFYILSKQKQIDDSLGLQLKNVKTKRMNMYDALSNIGLYNKKNLQSLFEYKTSHRSIQLDWYYVLVFLKYLNIGLDVGVHKYIKVIDRSALQQMAKEVVYNSSGINAIKILSTKENEYTHVLKERLLMLSDISQSYALKNLLVIKKILKK